MSIHLPQSKHSSDKLVSPNEHKNVKEGESEVNMQYVHVTENPTPLGMFKTL